MKIPASAQERVFFYEDVSRKCLASRNDRRSMYRVYRSYYLNGCSADSQYPAKFNKIYPHIALS